MDRSRILIALVLGLCLISLVVGIMNIATAGRATEFSVTTDSFLSTGRSGIAVLRLTGVIQDGYGTPGDPGVDRLISGLKDVGKNSAIKGLILEINSPGGAVGATKKLYDAVRELRKEKPVYAVVVDVAASGGYYVAAACDKIYAYRGSILGSIGVITIRPDISGLLAQYGVKVTTTKAGRYKDSSYPFRAQTAEEEAMVQAMIDDAYQQFISDVSEGRDQSDKTVRDWAEGRVFSGAQAKTNRMIDEFGGRDAAKSGMLVQLKITDDLPLLEPARNPFEEFLSSLPLTRTHQRPFAQLLQTPVMYFYPGAPGFAFEFLEGLTPVK